MTPTYLIYILRKPLASRETEGGIGLGVRQGPFVEQ